MLNPLLKLFYLELKLKLRTSFAWGYAIGFFFITLSLFPLGFSPDPNFLRSYMSGCIWMAALFASLLSIETIFLTDLEDSHLEQLLFSSLSFTAIIYIKLCVHWLLTELPLVLLVPILGWLFHLSFITTAILFLTLLIGTPVLTLLGSLGAALTIGLSQQGMLLSLLILPLLTPVLIFGVAIVQQAENGLAIVAPLAFFTGITLLAITVLPLAIAAILRFSIDD